MVTTPSDFGTRGARPTHPELLDWLARELIRKNWQLKPMHRLIMTSAVYMQSYSDSSANLHRDPNNHYLWRRNIRRLDAEAIRDSLLAVSSRLDRKMYRRGKLDATYPRRSIYLRLKRTQLVPELQMFDAPDALQGIGTRSTTTVAPQALMLLNSGLVRDCAADLAARLDATDTLPVTAFVNAIFMACLARLPEADETETTVRLFDSQIHSYSQKRPDEAAHLARIDLCQTILCLNEFVYVE